MKYLAPVAKEIGDKLEKSQNEGKQEIAELEEKLRLITKKQIDLLTEIGNRQVNASSSKKKTLLLDIEVQEEFIRLAEDYPYNTHVQSDMIREGIEAKARIVDLEKRMESLEKANQSFPLKKYSYSKKNETLN